MSPSLLTVLTLAAWASGAAASLAAWMVTADPPAVRAAALLAKMSLDQKVVLLHGGSNGGYTGSTDAIPELGVPGLTLNDGRQGFRPNSGSKTNTAFPAAIQVVATWDPSRMRAFGVAMSEEFLCKGSNVMLAPMLILARVPLDGRIFESTGADPELAYRFAFEMISGVQSIPGVIANADDFVLNNQESDRVGISAVCDERTLFELYYRGYKGAVDANVGSFMCSYNLVNDTHACENAVTLGDLKSPRGLNFSGWVLSDWGGVHSTVPSALNGLDQEMPGSDFFGPALISAVNAGEVPMSAIDDKVTRILVPMFRAGLFDTTNNGTEDTNCTSAAHTQTSRDIAAAGTVLLSNPNALLPLDASTIKSILVIGDDASTSPQCCGYGSGFNNPPYIVSPLDGITRRAGPGVNVTWVASPTSGGALHTFYSAATAPNGRGDTFLDFTCTECTPDYVDEGIEGYANDSPCTGCVELDLWYNGGTSSNFVSTAAWPPPAGYEHIRTTAWAMPLSFDPASSVVLELWGGNETVNGANPSTHPTFFTLATAKSRAAAAARGLTLVAPIARLLTSPVVPDVARIAKMAAAADVAIVCVSTPSSEGSDRPNLDLADLDDALVAAVVAAQPRTVVSLNSPSAIVMDWADQAGALLAAFYPGQEMGNALADVIFGDVNPAARLPMTWPKRNEDNPLPTPEQYPGVNGSVYYTEKLLIDYRWFDANSVAPRFPFGHGLSFTSFAYSSLSIDTASSAPNVVVTFEVKNTGARDGREVPQLYLAFPASAGEPVRVLRGFASVELAAGASAPVRLELAPRDMSIWDVGAYAWALQSGEFTVTIGASSRDFRLTGSFTL
jgi:beta-glucosidase